MAVFSPDRSLGYRAEVGVWGCQGVVVEVGEGDGGGGTLFSHCLILL